MGRWKGKISPARKYQLAAKEAGKPLPIDHPVCQNLFNLVREGVKLGRACQLSGISYKTIMSYKNRAQAGEEPFIEWVGELGRAQGDFIRENLDVIKGARDKNWTAAAWLLERTAPDEYGRNQDMKVKHEHKLVAPEQLEVIDAKVLTEELDKRLLEAGDGDDDER